MQRGAAVPVASLLILWYGAAQKTLVVIEIDVFHQTPTHQSWTQHIPLIHSLVHSSSACHMLGPVLGAGDLSRSFPALTELTWPGTVNKS